ncbi:MAG: hypothetical protein O7D86_07600 [Proteobacteria bacterium]|nr:hypothetical protein [Pseudomonadota bacterium]
MAILFWKKNKEIDAMAVSLADEFYSQIQPQVAIDFLKYSDRTSKLDKSNRKISKMTENILNRTAGQLIAFKKKHSIGIYGKARLHLNFMKRLNELGYPEELAKEINAIILLRSP